MRQDVLDIVVESIARTTDPELSRSVQPGTRIMEQGILNSLGILAVIAALQDRLTVTLPPEAITQENFESIHAISAMVERYQSGSQG